MKNVQYKLIKPKENIFKEIWRRVFTKDSKKKYEAVNTWTYYSKRYNRTVTISAGMQSDGATGAPDIDTDAWWVHDQLCDTGTFDDGSLVDNWIASTIFGDILWADGYEIRSVWWWWATWLFGGGAARSNGMRRVMEDK